MGRTSCEVRALRRWVRRTALVVAATAFLVGCDWTQLDFGPARTRFNPIESALTESSVKHLTTAWSKSCACGQRVVSEQAVPPPALVAGGLVYVVDGFSGATGPFALTLRAFDAKSGATRWSTPLGSAGFGTIAAAVGNGLVYVRLRPSSGSDRLVAFDAAAGTFRWQVTPPVPGPSGSTTLIGEPIVDAGFALLQARTPAAPGIVVAAVDTSGRIAWSAASFGLDRVGIGVVADPARHTVYELSRVFLSDGREIYFLTGYAVADGSVRSRVVANLPQNPTADLLSLGFANGLVIGTLSNFHGESFGAFAVRPDTGAVVWTGRGGDVVAITPEVTLERNRQASRLIAHDTSTGAVRWNLQLLGDGYVSAVAGNLIFGFEHDILHNAALRTVRRLADGALVASISGTGTITPSAGRVYVVTGTEVRALAPS
jgi:outer membrane protein assembly factor BamB